MLHGHYFIFDFDSTVFSDKAICFSTSGHNFYFQF